MNAHDDYDFVYDALPEQMKTAKAFLLWNLEGGGVKPRKVPYYISGTARKGRMDAPDDLAQLATFDTAIAAYHAGEWDGIGIAVGAAFPCVVVDFDGRIPESFEVVGAWTEISQSGKGLHAFYLPGTVPTWTGNNKAGIEVYTEKRFIALTGKNATGKMEPYAGQWDAAGTKASTTVPERSHDPFETMAGRLSGWGAERIKSELLSKMSAACGRDEWLRVAMGIMHQLGKTPEAEQLVREWSATSKAKYNEGDFDKMWRSLKPDPEGSAVTLRTVINMAKPSTNAPEVLAGGTVFVSFKDLIALKTNPTWLIRGFIEAGTLNAIAGAPKNFKSFIAVDMGLCVAAGIPWCGRTVTQGAVFVIAGEGSGGMSRRIAAWRKTHPEVPEGIPFFVTHRAHTLNADGAKVVADVIDEMAAAHGVNPVAVVIDTLARSFEGDENNTQDMNAFVLNVDSQLKREGRAVIIVHHSTKSKAELLRGSGALKAALDGLFEVAKDDKDLMRATFTTHFLKDAESQKPMVFNMERHVLGIDDELEEVSSLVPVLSIECRPLSERAKAAHVILKKLDKGDGVELALWRDNCEERSLLGSGKPEATKSAMRRLVAQLENSELIVKYEHGSYRCTN